MKNDTWALLWSKRQNALHIEPLEQWLSKNRVAYRDNTDLCDYHPIYIGEQSICHITADSVRSTLCDRAVSKPFPPIDVDMVTLPVLSMHDLRKKRFNQGA